MDEEDDKTVNRFFSKPKVKKALKKRSVAPAPSESHSPQSKTKPTNKSHTHPRHHPRKSTKRIDFNNKDNVREVSERRSKQVLPRKPLRVWKSKGKKGLVAVDKQSISDDSKVFNVDVAKNTDFSDWKKEASHLLPSVTGHHERRSFSMKESELSKTPSKNTKKALKLDPVPLPIEFPSSTSEASAEEYPRYKRTRSVSIVSSSLRSSLPSVDRKHVSDTRKSLANLRKSNVDVLQTLFGQTANATHQQPDVENMFRGEEWKRSHPIPAELEKPETLRDKINALRETSEHIPIKRRKRRDLVVEAEGNSHAVLDSGDLKIKEYLLTCAHIFESFYHDFISLFTIWQGDINDINGRFGIVVASYFVWLRRIIKLNIFTFIIAFWFIIFPEIYEQNFKQRVSEAQTQEFHINHLIHGEGYFHSSILYYSGYHNRYPDITKHPVLYNAALRFCFALLLILLMNTYSVTGLMSKFYSNIRLETKVVGVAKMETFKKIICAWDFSCGDVRAAGFLHKMIKQQLYILSKGNGKDVQELAAIEVHEHYRLLAFLVKKFGLEWGDFVMHIISNVVLLFSCVILGTTLYFLCHVKMDYYLECVSHRDDNVTRTVPYNQFCEEGDLSYKTIILSLPALFSSIVTLVLTKFIVYIGEMEHFDKTEHSVYAMMIRGGIFNLTSISVPFFFWYAAGQQMREQGYVAETIIGKEMYRLIVIQGLIDIVITFGFQFIYHSFRLMSNKEYKKPRFQPEYCAQEMFFIDSIARLGTAFCPPICFLVTVRLIADFYLKKYNLIHFSSHETYVANASSVYAPYLATYFISYLVIGFFIGFYATHSLPSQIDGPFLFYKESYTEVLTELVESQRGTHWLHTLYQPGFLLILLSTLVAGAYFCREWSKAYEPIEEQISELIMFERADKEILLKAFFEIARVSVDLTKADDEAEDVKKRKSEEDDKFDTLIYQAKRRRHFSDVNVADVKQIQLQNAGKEQKLRAHKLHHRQNMENIVNEIVETRRKRKGMALEGISSKDMEKLQKKYEQTVKHGNDDAKSTRSAISHRDNKQARFFAH